ncbi:MAG TPA: pantoate--beta-alanine ligase, partial [Thermoanaerobaculia bacterium]|nr:pantoate--beta-alanine ligase [Thermoanaerobaculia bacterium]
MKTVRQLEPLRDLVRKARAKDQSVGFVPTMGALHAGHLSLVRAARSQCGLVVVSIFVNPLQFAPGEDFARYPRQEEQDTTLLARAGADVLYLPDADLFYPPDFSTAVEVSGVSEGGEGKIRPGHLRGVATVVAKLFLHVSPDVAYFGRKDLQQAAVVRRMVRDLDFPLRVAVAETVREQDGLAMSSRNAYLSPEERRSALSLRRGLAAAHERYQTGERSPEALLAQAKAVIDGEPKVRLDYLELRDA